MYEDARKAYDELRNAVWMVAISLGLGVLSLVGACQWVVQDIQLADRIENINQTRTGVIQEIATSECTQPRPTGDGHICAQYTEWWSPIDDTSCIGGQCYVPAWWLEVVNLLIEAEESYFPIFVPGLLPLIFLTVVIRKITKARRALMFILHNQRPFLEP